MEPQIGTASASQLHALFGEFFAAKSAHDVDGTMAYISPGMITYTDATLGMALDSYAAVKAGSEQYMPTRAPPARSYEMPAPADRFPRDMQESKVATAVPAELARAAAALHGAFAAPDASAAAAAMHTDAVLTDMALRTQVIGRIETVRYLERALGRVPYGQGSALRHVVGGAGGGGFEWTAGPDDADGLITAITSVYGSRQIDPASKRAPA
jgi:hypothetical protein